MGDSVFPERRLVGVVDPKSGDLVNEIQGPMGPGLTKRELFAAMAMQGILANEGPASNDDPKARAGDIGRAVAYADALLAELARPQEGGS